MQTSDLYYVDISMSGAGEEFGALANELFKCVHGFNSGHPNGCLGLDLPGWAAGSAGEWPPRILRLFGAQAAITEFAGQTRIKRMRAIGLSVTPGLRAPVVEAYAVLRRDTSADKVKPSHQRRRERRGHVALAQPRPAGLVIPVASLSTRQTFLYKLKKTTACGGPDVEFNNYGLTRLGALPQF